MKASELRIGNYVHTINPRHNDKVLKIESIGDNESVNVFFREYKLSEIEPIPLTEEILLKFGFKKEKTTYINDYYIFINGVWNIKFKREGYCSFITFGCFLTDIKYVHELQNLYFALTKEELTFN